MPPRSTGTFHEGEREVQARAGAADVAEFAASFVLDRLSDGHASFLAALPFVVLAARDEKGRVWASLLEGPDGFLSAADPRRVRIAAVPAEDDPLHASLGDGRPVGLLGIELATRRRNRLTGRVTRTDAGLILDIDQAFGNCPQYIHPRPVGRRRDAAPGPCSRATRLGDAQIARIRRADTFFIATGHPDGDGGAHGMDASHRGGAPGFVSVSDDGRRLRFPDYSGNNFFNTLGNLQRDPRAGLLFVDFDGGGLLHLTGRMTIDWTGDPVSGARRHLDMEIEGVVDRPGALALRWGPAEAALRRLVLARRCRETADVTSFVLEAENGSRLPDFAPGQHLPLRMRSHGGTPLERSYSLSGPSDAGRWRISVRRDPRGSVSRFLHDHLQVGDSIEALAPSGSFGAPGNGPVVLVSAGIGVTPMISHLHAAALQGREALFVHAARRAAEHAFRSEVKGLVDAHPNLRLRIAYSAPDAGDDGHHWTGRLTTDHLLGAVGNPADAVFLLCGPPGFVASLQSGLAHRGIAGDRVFAETF